MRRHLNVGGLVIAGLGFFLTRFTVTLAFYESPVRFYLAGVVPLVLGLGLATFGVALFVADVDPSLVRTTARWCVLGTLAMLVLVVLTVLGSTAGSVSADQTIRSQSYLSNFLIGGAVGGTLTGLYAARTRRQTDELRHQANRLEVLNRQLRHEVLNAVAVIKGYTTVDREEFPNAPAVIESRSDHIAETIRQVRYLTRSTKASQTSLATVDLQTHLETSVASVREAHPEATISVSDDVAGLTVDANDRLERVFTQLLDNAVVHTERDAPHVEVSVTTTASRVRVAIHDEGTGLPESQQRLLETGEITEFDDPSDGYGLNVVRLLVESLGGAIETAVTDEGTTITVVLARSGEREFAIAADRSGLAGVRPSVPHLAVILGAAILAGVCYGLVSELLGGSVSAIGVFYGIQDPIVGWLTHEFHSAVFAFAFAGLVSYIPSRYRNSVGSYVAVGAGWGVALWAVAAGVVAPLWLVLLGIPAPVPNLSPDLLVTHLVWGVTLGLLTALGYRFVVPWLARFGDGLN